ncbi:MAG TPA: GNAT family N-acetyltransferase [Tepidisphaeraceae bacterium]|nr:GNAT family N-acetyltransferase [Tepidisphaeraceae bacterium]
MTIRSATPNDVPRVLPMVEKIVAFHEALDPSRFASRGSPSEKYRDWLIDRSQDPRSVFLVADVGSTETAPQLAGFLVATVTREIPIYKTVEYGFIHDLWVEENFRNEGYARQMVMLAVERFHEIGVKQIRLDTAYANQAAQNLFKSCGFRPVNIEWLIEP